MKLNHTINKRIVIVTVSVLAIVLCWMINQQIYVINTTEQQEASAQEVLDTAEEESTIVHVPAEERLAGESVSVDVIESDEAQAAELAEMIAQLKRETMIDEEVLPIETLYQESDVDAFFADAIFVGDSVTVGLANYYEQNKGSIFTDTTQFLARVGCSAKMCLSENAVTTYAKYMPSYQGSICKVEDGVAASGAQKVFIDYGLNDLVGCTPDEFFENMVTLINRIQEKSPNVQIYVIGTTYVVDGAEKLMLTNENIRLANEKMKTYCQEVGWGYLNIADYLADNNGTLQSIYSSDQYVHQNTHAYEIWVKVLRNYAKKQIDAGF